MFTLITDWGQLIEIHPLATFLQLELFGSGLQAGEKRVSPLLYCKELMGTVKQT
ncbi:hypothetical protein [Erwinia amylovora]|uniref:hypothetical protein n=1 Tax=Erwinia amylovora TaxID=552 RepID=UPI0014443B39|nr:hypothetical protein [Erwinia amylovora]